MTSLLDDFFARALLGGIGIALAAAPLGCFVVWQRMSYFGSTLAHSALLGIAIAVSFDLPPVAAITVTCLALALLLHGLIGLRYHASDTLLGIIGHGAMAAGLLILSQQPGMRIDLMGYLFGDILAITRMEIAWIIAADLLILLLLWRLWQPMVNISVNEDIAWAEGIRVPALRLLYLLLLALVIALAMRLIGILLMTSLLIFPAAIARHLAKSPGQMALLASGIGVAGIAAGLFASRQWDSPASAAIVTAYLILFIICSLGTLRRTG